MSAGNPTTPDELTQVRKSFRPPTQAPAPHGAPGALTPAQFTAVRSRLSKKRPTQGPALKGAPVSPTADQFAQIRKSFKAPTQAPTK
jgi:hypothetical protein